MKGHNLGRGCSILLSFLNGVGACYDDLCAFNAPSECAGLVNRGLQRDFRQIKKRIKAITGLKYDLFMEEVARRTSPRWVHYHLNDGII